MNKKTLALICVVLFAIAVFGCSNADISHEDIIGDPNEDIIGDPIDPTFGSFEELNDYLLSAREYSRNGRLPEISESEKTEIKWSVNVLNLGDMEYYYMPSWIPEGFHLDNISIFYGYFSYCYISDDCDDGAHWLDNIVTFSWRRSQEITLEYSIGFYGLKPVEGIEGLYFYEYGPPKYPARRDYFWLEEGCLIQYSLPLRLITEAEHPSELSLSDELDEIMKNAAKKVILERIGDDN